MDQLTKHRFGTLISEHAGKARQRASLKLIQKDTKTAKSLAYACKGLEWVARYFFVNLPTFVIASFPGVDYLCSLSMTYFLLQVVGICWAILLNAGFALACRVTYILPNISMNEIHDPTLYAEAATRDVDAAVNATHMDIQADLTAFSAKTTIQLLASFYVAYASIRVMVAFTNHIYAIALSSTKDFPEVSKHVIDGGMKSLYLTRLSFVPVVALQLGLISADTVCLDIAAPDINHANDGSSNNGSMGIYNSTITHSYHLQSFLCEHSGFSWITTRHPHIRSLIFSVVLIMVLQIWQAYLQQFPKWANVFQSMARRPRLKFQSSATALLIGTLLTLSNSIWNFNQIEMTDLYNHNQQILVTIFILGWTVWLFCFVPFLTDFRGEHWAKTVTPKHIQHMIAYIRISQIMLLFVRFWYLASQYGLLQAQVDITFLTILLPIMYSTVYLLGTRILRLKGNYNSRMLLTSGITSMTFSLVTTMYLAKTDAKGSLLLVFFHSFSKQMEFYGEVLGAGKSVEDLDSEYNLTGEYSKATTPEIRSTLSYPPILERAGGDTYADTSTTSSAGATTDAASSSSDVADTTNSTSTSSSCSDKEEEQSTQQIPAILGAPKIANSPLIPSSPNRKRSDSFLQRSSSDGNLEELRNNSVEKLREDNTSNNSNGNTSGVHKVFRSSHSSNSLFTLAQEGAGKQGHEETETDTSITTAKHPSGMRNRHRASSITTKLLFERGHDDNPLVSLGIPKHIRRHWLVRIPKRNMRFIGNIARSWTTIDNIYSGTIRIFVSLGALLILFLAITAIAAYTQRSLDVFPRLIDFQVQHNSVKDKDSGVINSRTSLLFDHKISNVTLYVNPMLTEKDKEKEEEDETSSGFSLGLNAKAATSRDDDIFDGRTDNSYFWDQMTLEKPHYMACSWRWHDLSILDFALLSEIAYFDEDHDSNKLTKQGSGSNNNTKSNVQNIVNTLFPRDDFITTSSHADNRGSGVRYVEVYSKKHDITILAVRGTDVGRLQDIMEDFKLYAEPVIFSLLSTAFPTIRMWNHETTSRIIEWLYEVNSFFGLQGEPEYYRPLTQRVMDIAAKANDNDNNSDKDSCSNDDGGNSSNTGSRLVITGHSLGGGLARIVGTLTAQASISFSPPGLGLSYRKYSFKQKDQTWKGSGSDANSRQKQEHKHKKPTRKEGHQGEMRHHESLAIITEFDLVPTIDQQVGLVQNIQCDHKDSAIHSSACHLLEGTICHLLKHCGDPKERFTHCQSMFDVSVIAPSLGVLFWQYRYIAGPIIFLFVVVVLLAIVPELV